MKPKQGKITAILFVEGTDISMGGLGDRVHAQDREIWFLPTNLKVVRKVCKTRVFYNEFDPISLSELFFTSSEFLKNNHNVPKTRPPSPVSFSTQYYLA